MDKLFIPKTHGCIVDDLYSILSKVEKEKDLKRFNSKDELFEYLSTLTLNRIFLATHYNKDERIVKFFKKNVTSELINAISKCEFVYGFICNGYHFLNTIENLKFVSYSGYIPAIFGLKQIDTIILNLFESIFEYLQNETKNNSKSKYDVILQLHESMVDDLKGNNRMSEAIFYQAWSELLVSK